MSSVGQAIGTVVGGVIGYIIGGPGGAVKGAALGYTLFAPRDSSSPTYSFGSTYNTRSHELPVPVVYGRNRVAGNTIFENISGSDNDKIALQIGVSEGPIKSITEIKANDVDINAKSRVKLGSRTQSADPINDLGQTFPYLAYISTELTANENLQGSPTITSIVEGRIVKVWNGSAWAEQYSTNPAWCILDFLTNKRYGLGIDEQYIDLDSFIDVAAACDQLVPDGQGGMEKRYQLDYVIDARKSSLDHLREMLATFGAYLLYSQGELRLKLDGPETPVQHFNMDNIIADSFSYSKASRKEFYNRVRVQYIDPNEHWEKIYAQYSIDSDIRKRGVVPLEIPLLGITRFSQAGRMARFYQKKSWFCNTFCQFRVGIGALECEVGDVITVTHDVPGWVKKEFRILEIHEHENDEMTLICQEYNIAVYSDDGVVKQVKKDTELPNPFLPPESVTNLSLVEQAEVLKDGTWIPKIYVTWEKPDNLFWKAGHIYLSADGGITWHYIQRVEGTEYTIDNLAPGTYRVRIVSENNRGIKQDFGLATTGQITVTGKDVEPSDVTWADCSFIDKIVLRWNPVPDVDVNEYEVRLNTNFGSDDEFLVYRGKGLSFTLDRPAQRQYTFFIKAKDRSGNYSKNATPKIVENAVPSTPPQPIITEFFSSLWIEILPVPDNDILGYNLYMTPCDAQGNPTGDTQVTTYPTAQRVTYQAPSGSHFLVQVSAFDVLGEGEKSAPVLAATKKIDNIAEFAQNIIPPRVVNVLPDLPDANFPEGSLVYLTSDGKLYKSTGDTWATVETQIGEGDITETLIADNSISTPKLKANAVTSDKIAANSITAGKIAAGAVGADEIAANAITADKVGANEIITTSANIRDAVIDAAKIINVETSQITVGGQPAKLVNPKPAGAHLWHFDRSVVSTDGIQPESGAVYTLRPNEGKFGGAVAVEEGTTNYANNGNFATGDFTGWDFWGDGSTSTIVSPGYSDNYCVKITYDGRRSRGIMTPYNMPVSEGDLVTFQFKYKGDKPDYVFIMKEGTSNKNFVPTSTPLKNGWHLATYTWESDFTGNIGFMISRNSEGISYVDEVQYEKKPFATSFVDGTRAAGRLVYPTSFNMNEGTIHVWFYFNGTTAWNTPRGTVFRTKQGSGGLRNHFWLFTSTESGSNSLRFQVRRDDGSAAIAQNIKHFSDISDGWHSAVVRWSTSAQSLNVFMDGQLLTSYTYPIDGLLPFDAIDVGCRDTTDQSNTLVDELLILPYAATEEEIQQWYNSGAPFYDNESVQSAGTVLLNVEGITTENNGNSTHIAFGRVVNENSSGDKSILDEGRLSFYKSGYPNTPFKYLARTCQGISPSGTYVNLETGKAHYPDGTVVDMTTDPNYAGVVAVPWERKPVILPAISALKSYDPAFKDYVQNYECYVEQDQNGFYVYGRTIVPGSNYNTSSVNFTPSAYDSVESTQLLTAEVDVTKILIKFQLRRAYTATPGPTEYGNKSWIKIEYRRDGTSNWTNYGTFYSYADTRTLTRTVTISGLSPGKYWVKCTLYKDSAPYVGGISGQYNGIATWVSWTRVNDTVISNGDVFWLAVENSID